MFGEDYLKANMIMAWLWILMGFASGAVIGTRFHKPGWLGGYGSHQRRLYRLGHISFFGLGAVNFMFALTAQPFMTGVWLRIASLAFLIGAGSMPLACLAFAHNNRLHLLFSIPVSALLVGAVLTFVQLFRL